MAGEAILEFDKSTKEVLMRPVLSPILTLD